MGRGKKDSEEDWDKKNRDIMCIGGDVGGGGTARGSSVGDRIISVKPSLRCSTRGSSEEDGLWIMR